MADNSQTTTADLILTTREGEEVRVSSLRGAAVVIGFISKAACHTGNILQFLDQVFLELGPTYLQCIACIVDLDRGEELREYGPFMIPIAAARRREVADFLRVPMSGFSLPRFVIFDHAGRLRLMLHAPPGEKYWELVDNLKRSIEPFVEDAYRAHQEAPLNTPAGEAHL